MAERSDHRGEKIVVMRLRVRVGLLLAEYGSSSQSESRERNSGGGIETEKLKFALPSPDWSVPRGLDQSGGGE